MAQHDVLGLALLMIGTCVVLLWSCCAHVTLPFVRSDSGSKHHVDSIAVAMQELTLQHAPWTSVAAFRAWLAGGLLHAHNLRHLTITEACLCANDIKAAAARLTQLSTLTVCAPDEECYREEEGDDEGNDACDGQDAIRSPARMVFDMQLPADLSPLSRRSDDSSASWCSMGRDSWLHGVTKAWLEATDQGILTVQCPKVRNINL